MPETLSALAKEPHSSPSSGRLLKGTGKGPKPLRELLNDGLITITPELALRIIREAPFDRQRPVRPQHVAAVAEQMKNHEWTSGTQIHFGRLPDGMLALVNGQHRMHAVIKAQTAVPFQVLITKVESNEGLNRLYRRHDRLAAPRTITDALAAEGITERYTIDRMFAQAIFRAVPIIATDFHYSTRQSERGDAYLMRSDEAKLRLCAEYWPIGELYQDAVASAIGPLKMKLRAAGVCAVGLVTLKHQEAKADAFWRGLAAQDGLGRDDPRSAYTRYVLAATRTGNTSVLTHAKAAATAWNAFYRGDSLQIVRIAVGPVKIFGTPFEKVRKG